MVQVCCLSNMKLPICLYKVVYDRGKTQLVCNVFSLPYMTNVAMQCVTTNTSQMLV